MGAHLQSPISSLRPPMDPRNRFVLIAALVLSSSRALCAQTVSVSGNPGLLRISTAVAGSEPTAVSDAASTFTISTPAPGNNKYQVLMSLSANMPANVTLNATLAAPPGSAGTALGPIALDVTPRALLTGIKKNFSGSGAITYQLVATAAAGVIPSSSRTVTFTITTYP